MSERQHVALPIRIGGNFETQSGLQLNAPHIYGVLAAPLGARTAGLLIHPASNLMNHYLIDELAQQGMAVLALNTRYCGGDHALLMENAIRDVGAGVRHLRDPGFARVVLLGNSGGASLVAFYQAQAERISVTATPAGDPLQIVAAELPPADGIALMAAHPGRSRLMVTYIDAAIIDERNPDARDPALDIYDPANPPPFSDAFVASVRTAQRARSDAITIGRCGGFALSGRRPAGRLTRHSWFIGRTRTHASSIDRSTRTTAPPAGIAGTRRNKPICRPTILRASPR